MLSAFNWQRFRPLRPHLGSVHVAHVWVRRSVLVCWYAGAMCASIRPTGGSVGWLLQPLNHLDVFGSSRSLSVGEQSRPREHAPLTVGGVKLIHKPVARKGFTHSTVGDTMVGGTLIHSACPPEWASCLGATSGARRLRLPLQKFTGSTILAAGRQILLAHDRFPPSRRSTGASRHI